MSYKKNDQGEYEFTRAAHDEMSDAQKRYGVGLAIAMMPTEQKGVWLLAVEAYRTEGPLQMAPIASWRGSWPNSTATSFGAFLYAATHRVVRMVEAWHGQEDRSSEASRN